MEHSRPFYALPVNPQVAPVKAGYVSLLHAQVWLQTIILVHLTTGKVTKERMYEMKWQGSKKWRAGGEGKE